MDKHVVLEDVGIGKALAALRTNKGSIICVGPLVTQATTVVDVGAVTVTTLELAISSVHHLVSFQLTGGQEAGGAEST